MPAQPCVWHGVVGHGVVRTDQGHTQRAVVGHCAVDQRHVPPIQHDPCALRMQKRYALKGEVEGVGCIERPSE